MNKTDTEAQRRDASPGSQAASSRCHRSCIEVR